MNNKLKDSIDNKKDIDKTDEYLNPKKIPWETNQNKSLTHFVLEKIAQLSVIYYDLSCRILKYQE